MDPIPDLCKSSALLSGGHPGCLFEGEWVRYPLATYACSCDLRGIDDPLQFSEIPKKAKIDGWKMKDRRWKIKD
jgi:hypothetical protein